jgi:rare lipoprotein A
MSLLVEPAMARPTSPVLALLVLFAAGLSAPASAAPAEELSGTVLPLLAAPVSAAGFLERVRRPQVATAPAHVPRTAHDNSPYRFNMTQNGRRMTAEEFEAWMRARGIRVATGRPAAAPAAAAPAATVAAPACTPTVAITC